MSRVLSTTLDPRSDAAVRNDAAQRALVQELRESLATAGLGGPAKARERHTSRGKLLPRDRVDQPARPRLAVPRALAAGRARHVRRRRPGRRRHHGHRARRWPRVRRGGQRRDRQGRHLLPDDGQEAPAGAGGGAAQSAAVHLPRRLRRRLPAQAGRGLPRPGALRPHLLQPGHDERAWHPADRVRDGVVHRRRGLRAGDVGRSGHRPRPGHHLPGRPAAGEGRDRRGRDRRGARRRPAALPHERRHRPPRGRRPRRAADRPQHRGHPQAAVRSPLGSAADGGPGCRPGRPLRGGPGRRADPVRRPRGHRAPRRRFAVPRVQGRVRRHAGDRVRARARAPGRDCGQQRGALRRVGAQGGALHRALRPARGCRCCSCRTSPGSWSGGSTRPAASPRTAPRW